MNSTNLSNLVSVTPYYQRSVRLSDDLEHSDIVNGYVCHETARNLLNSMVQQVINTNQRAFTWTGPFGSGKSSLALVLAIALSGDSENNRRAQKVLGIDTLPDFSDAFPISKKGWMVIPVVGSRRSFIEAISQEISRVSGRVCDSKDSILQILRETADSAEYDGVVLIVDEMGKFLEAVTTTGDDVYFFQELAELCSRTRGHLVTIGILHQSFKQYGKTQRLNEHVQHEWAKVHGRFADIPLISSTDEVIELLGNAITSDISVDVETLNKEFLPVVESMKSRRQGVQNSIVEKLVKCWPLHPTTALILGPASKRQFGQNERSVFSFLGSSEPYGFQEFLREAAIDSYKPSNYWDYLQANLEPAILSSNDSHRWGIASNAVSKAEAQGSEIHASVVKNIAAIDLFKNGSGLAADALVLRALYPHLGYVHLNSVIEDLERWKIVVHRRFNGAWSIFEGSDFDIEKAVSEEKREITSINAKKLSELAKFSPVVAKKHLYDTGSLRWMGISIVERAGLFDLMRTFKYSPNEFGQFVVLIDSESPTSALPIIEPGVLPGMFVIGQPENAQTISDYAKDLLAHEAVFNRPELEGDAVARKELDSRLTSIKMLLERQLALALKNIEWRIGSSETFIKSDNLSRLASEFADKVFAQSPQIFSELLNRDSLSSNSVRARKDLIYKMLSHSRLEDLGMQGYPPEKGLYLTTLKNTGLHHKSINSEAWSFSLPKDDIKNFEPLWVATEKYIQENKEIANAAQICSLWRKPPFGVKEGVIPVLFWTYVLSTSARYALYRDGYYLPEIEEIDIDYSLQNMSRFEIRGVELTKARVELLNAVSRALSKCDLHLEITDPLSAARKLVSVVVKLQPWAKKTRTVSAEAISLRDLLLKASDPHKVIFHDLISVLKTDDVEVIENKLAAIIRELSSAFEMMLSSFTKLMFEQLCASSEMLIQRRALNIKDTAGDFLLEAFIGRLANFDGSDASISAVLSLITEKNIADWTDQDSISARNSMITLAKKFRELETIAAVNSRQENREAIAMVYGTAGKDFIKHIEVDDNHTETLDSITIELISGLKSKNLPVELQYAAIARIFEKLVMEDNASGN